MACVSNDRDTVPCLQHLDMHRGYLSYPFGTMSLREKGTLMTQHPQACTGLIHSEFWSNAESCEAVLSPPY
jgi:hypothetical protein